MPKTWTPQIIDYNKCKDEINLERLTCGDCPAFIIQNFYDEKSCKTIVKRISNFQNSINKDVRKIGVSLIRYITQKSEYFFQAEKARSILRSIFHELDDPRKKIHRLFSDVCPQKKVTVAKEKDGKYACGVIRIHGNDVVNTLHRDNVKFEAPNFLVSKFTTQLSAVLFLQPPEKGGQLIIYHRSWKKSDEHFRNIEFGYSRNVLQNCKEHVTIKPKQGELVIINPNFFHEILPIEGKLKRITLGLFLAFSKNSGPIVTWS